MNRFHSCDCKNIWDEPSWARVYCVFSRVCPYNQYPLLASRLKKSFQNFWGLHFPLEILQGWFWNPVGFLKENADLKNFENFFSTCWLTVDIGYKDKPLKICNIVSLKMVHLKYFYNQMSGTYSSRQEYHPLKRLVNAVGPKCEKSQSWGSITSVSTCVIVVGDNQVG